MHKHLAIMNRPVIEAILAGKKTVESRFSKHKIPPLGVIAVGDLVYIKPPGQEMVGQFRVKKVIEYQGLTPEDVERIFKEYKKVIGWGKKEEEERYFQEKRSSKFGTLVFISESERFITPPVKIKKSDQRGWMVLE